MELVTGQEAKWMTEDGVKLEAGTTRTRWNGEKWIGHLEP